MKTDVIKEALESVKKEDPKLYDDVVEYISSNRNKTGVLNIFPILSEE